LLFVRRKSQVTALLDKIASACGTSLFPNRFPSRNNKAPRFSFDLFFIVPLLATAIGVV
jgi:hypothetical protein